MRRLMLVVTAFLCLSVAGAAPAAAALRTASPGATGDCVNAPCDFRQAVEGAANGDEVVVTPGEYTITTQIVLDKTFTIHGVAGAPRPRINRTGANNALVFGGHQTVRHLEFVGRPDSGLLIFGGDLMEDVVARQENSESGCRLNAAYHWPHTMRNVVCISVGGEGLGTNGTGAAPTPRTDTLRNVTAIGATNSVIHARSGGWTLKVVNSILRPGVSLGTNETGAFHLSNNNYGVRNATPASVVDEGPNYTDTPIFAGAGTGDYHQDRFSPTIDRGAESLDNGAFDFDGDLRTIGSLPDIGADEYVPPPGTTTGSATDVTATEATLSAAVESRGAPTEVRFEWGATPAYGNSVAAGTVPASNGSAPVSVRVTGLEPGTPYHFRVVATNKTGSSAGDNASFATAAAPAPAAPGAPFVPPPTGPAGPGPATTPPDLPEFEFPSRRRPPVASGAVRTEGKYVVARIKGTLEPPDGVSDARACEGDVTLSLFKGKKRLAKDDDELSSKCAFSTTLKVRRSKVGDAKTLKLVIEFSGNDVVDESSASYTVKVAGRR